MTEKLLTGTLSLNTKKRFVLRKKEYKKERKKVKYTVRLNGLTYANVVADYNYIVPDPLYIIKKSFKRYKHNKCILSALAFSSILKSPLSFNLVFNLCAT